MNTGDEGNEKKFSGVESDVSKWELFHFDILETLGTGTFGRVKLIRHKFTGQYFAIKILKKSTIIRLKQVEHISNERELLTLINCDFTVNLYKTFKDEFHLMMILEYVPGGELFSHIRKAGKFPNDVKKTFSKLRRLPNFMQLKLFVD
jgi:serine/threonine protein kinase